MVEESILENRLYFEVNLLELVHALNITVKNSFNTLLKTKFIIVSPPLFEVTYVDPLHETIEELRLDFTGVVLIYPEKKLGDAEELSRDGINSGD